MGQSRRSDRGLATYGLPRTTDIIRASPQSQTCHFRTHASPQNGGLFNDLVGTSEQRGRNFNVERLGRLEIYDQLKFCRPLNWQIGRRLAL